MSTPLIMSLSALKKESGARIGTSILHGLTSTNSQRLIRMQRRSGENVGIPSSGVRSVASHSQHRQRLLTFDSHGSFIRTFNSGLRGGSYPILLFALGAAAGAASGGAGLLFGLSTLGLDLSNRDTEVLARAGDQVWGIEEIGRVYERNTFSSNRWIAQHIMSYLLVDPFRSGANQNPKGWLIHEQRTRVLLDDDL